MQLIEGAAVRVTLGERLAAVRGIVVALLLLGTGAFLAWLIVATPFIASYSPGVRPSAPQLVAGIIAWAFAILVPFAFLVLGVAKGLAALEHVAALRTNPHAPRLARHLPEDVLVATNVRLPDGRLIPELILGPFGLAILSDVPPREASRRTGDRWEIRNRRGRWIPIESPLDRAARDAERVRRWLDSDDRDFLVKVHSALVTDDATLARSRTTAVIAPAQIAAWIAALPPQRGLTPYRVERVAELVRTLATRR